jgi:hypothetical protein
MGFLPDNLGLINLLIIYGRPEAVAAQEDFISSFRDLAMGLMSSMPT